MISFQRLKTSELINKMIKLNVLTSFFSYLLNKKNTICSCMCSNYIFKELILLFLNGVVWSTEE